MTTSVPKPRPIPPVVRPAADEPARKAAEARKRAASSEGWSSTLVAGKTKQGNSLLSQATY